MHTSVDTGWLLLCTVFVLLMQGGFLLLETGLMRRKNSVNVALKNIADLIVGGLVYMIIGFYVMFGVGAFAFADMGGWKTAYLLYSLVFAVTTATIMSGAVAERIKFRAYIVIVVVVTALLYPLFGGWAWGVSL